MFTKSKRDRYFAFKTGGQALLFRFALPKRELPKHGKTPSGSGRANIKRRGHKKATTHTGTKWCEETTRGNKGTWGGEPRSTQPTSFPCVGEDRERETPFSLAFQSKQDTCNTQKPFARLTNYFGVALFSLVFSRRIGDRNCLQRKCMLCLWDRNARNRRTTWRRRIVSLYDTSTVT